MMYFRKPSSISLLARAERAEASADAALAIVSKARAKAVRQRLLAARVEAEETAVRLEKKALTTELLSNKASHDYSLALGEQSKAESALLVAKRYVVQTLQCLEACERESDAAGSLATVARKQVPVTESKESNAAGSLTTIARKRELVTESKK